MERQTPSSMELPYCDATFKITIVGESHTGKTALLEQYIKQRFLAEFEATIGASLLSKKLRIEGKACRLEMWDTAGQERFRELLPLYTRGACCIVLVFDVTRRPTFTQLATYLPLLNQPTTTRIITTATTITTSSDKALLVLVANQCDLTAANDDVDVEDNDDVARGGGVRAVSSEEAEQFATANGFRYFETSATSYDSVSAVFHHIARTLLDAKVDANALHRAAIAGHVTDIEHALKSHIKQQHQHQQQHKGGRAIDVADQSGWTAMHYACWHGHVGAVEALVRLGSRAMDTGDLNHATPVFVAAENGHAEVIDTLVRLGSTGIDTPAHSGWTPMHVAAEMGRATCIETLCRLGSRAIDAPNSNGCTPMHRAAYRGHVEAIESLVRLGSRAIDAANSAQWTPLSMAAWSGETNAIEALVRLGSNAIDAPNRDRMTPLAVAAQQARVPVIEALVRLGSGAIDTPDFAGTLPLHRACEYGNVQVVEALLRFGSRALDPPFVVSQTTASSRAMRSVLQAVGLLPISSDEADAVIEVRYRLYFSRSLIHRLISEMMRAINSNNNKINSGFVSCNSTKQQSKDKCQLQ